MSTPPPPVTPQRLRFIDMARAVAILLMLEGHFVDVTLAMEWRVPGHPVYDVWLYCRGLAAPMFFTVTGLIFAYLLTGAREPGFLGVRRVRRGLLRAGELMFWGYLLQTDLTTIRGGWGPWFQAFHVLQCIAVGLLAMIVIFGIFRKAGPWVLMTAYLVTGLLVFLAAVLLANHAGHVPEGAPAFIQNVIKGPIRAFPVAPWLAFTLHGAAIGVFVRHRTGGSKGGISAAGFLVLGILLKVFGWSFDRMIGNLMLDVTGHAAAPRILPDNLHGRIGQILIILGILIWFENRFRPGASWFQTIGRNTFPIYVSHVVILYGGIFGVGLKSCFAKSLDPFQAALGALLFLAFFGLCAQGLEPLMSRWSTWRARRKA